MTPIDVEFIYVGKHSTDIKPKVTKANIILIVAKQIITLSQPEWPLIKGRK